MHRITKELLSKRDIDYKKFNGKIVSDTNYEMIGVRVPEIRNIVKTVVSRKDAYSFFKAEHFYYEEYLAHGLLISKIDDKEETYALLNDFLPKIDNWAICDTVAMSIKQLAKDKKTLYEHILIWLKSDLVYTVRFGIVCLLTYFTEKEYSDKIITIISEIQTDEYYINMALAWLLSVMLVKNYDEYVGLIESKSLPKFVQNKAIDKSRDSFRISKEKKQYLKTFKI